MANYCSRGCRVRRVSPGVGSAVGCGISWTSSSFRVGERGEGKVLSLFFGAFLLVLAKFFFGGGSWAIILLGLDNFLIFPDFLRF